MSDKDLVWSEGGVRETDHLNFEWPEIDDTDDQRVDAGYGRHPLYSLGAGERWANALNVDIYERIAHEEIPAYVALIWVGDTGKYVFITSFSSLLDFLRYMEPLIRTQIENYREKERDEHVMSHLGRWESTCFYCRKAEPARRR